MTKACPGKTDCCRSARPGARKFTTGRPGGPRRHSQSPGKCSYWNAMRLPRGSLVSDAARPSMPITQTLLTWLHKSAGASLGRRLAVRILLFSALTPRLSTAFQLNAEYRRDVGDIESRLRQVRSTFSDSLTSAVWTANP